jgi:hypothetical protein
MRKRILKLASAAALAAAASVLSIAPASGYEISCQAQCGMQNGACHQTCGSNQNCRNQCCANYNACVASCPS